jgi:hypothetical protein
MGPQIGNTQANLGMNGQLTGHVNNENFSVNETVCPVESQRPDSMEDLGPLIWNKEKDYLLLLENTDQLSSITLPQPENKK